MLIVAYDQTIWLSEKAEAEVQAADSAAKETAFVALSLAEFQEKYKALKIQYASEVASY